MLLIFPPVAKPCEPPAGVAMLAGALHAHSVPCRVLDANLEGLLWLLEQPPAATDTWTRRAGKNLPHHLAALRDPQTYGSPDRYARAVRDVNRLLAVNGRERGADLGLADCQHPHLSPLRSADLLAAAEHPEQNPFYPYFSRRLPEMLDGVRVVGFSLNYLSQSLCTFAMAGYVRKRFPGLTVVLGGGLVTSWMKRPGWRNPFGGLFDHLIAGPGELPLLAQAGVAPQQTRALPEYDSLPLRDYLSPGVILPYSAASGCYWNRCSFCPERAEGNRYAPVPVPQVLVDLQTLTARTSPTMLHLLDNAISPALLRGMAETPPGVPWYGFARFDEQLADLDFCRALKRSGCVMLKLGLESGDQGVLDALRKGIELGTVSRVLQNLRQAGIGVYLYLLFGTPAEDEEAARRTLEFVVRHRDAIGFLNLALFNMPAFGDEAGEYGTEPFYDGDLSLYTGFRHPRGWDRKQVRRFLAHEFKREPAVAAILRNDPPLFTSNHAAFFAGR
ncbi:MAG: radical SAM protein [Desulfuromonadales bacterium]|nr:MAG: radical SAM protein [Desulfuromonadales bacterium]